MKNTAIYPGTFDPITNGHLDLVERSLRFFDRLIIAVADNPDKKPLFGLEERLPMIEEAVKGYEVPGSPGGHQGAQGRVRLRARTPDGPHEP
jgi:cytidyltransferase-like protein